MNKVISIDEDERLKRLLAAAEPGEQFELTLDGKIVASVIPTARPADSAQVKAALERIAKIAAGQTLGGLSITDLIAEGRK